MAAPAMAAIGGDERRLAWVSAAVLVAYLVLLAACYRWSWWFVGEDGRLVSTDFVNVWAAGRLALDGNPSAIYDWVLHRRMEVAALGHDFAGYYGWHYPPMLLFAAVPLAALPYMTAWLGWSAVTALFLIWALWRVVPRAGAVLPLMAAPAGLLCVAVGQNGFLTAGLIAATLSFLDRRPVLAGVFLGLLTYKPQFGLLFPLALLAGGHWRALAAAAVTAIAWAGASGLAFGTDTWAAFIRSLASTAAVLRDGAPGWGKLQSVYALLHALGDGWAWAGQAAVMVALAALVVWAFRRPLPPTLRNAVLAAAVVMAAPYSYVYDLPVLAVAGAFLIRDFLESGFTACERRVLILALLAPALFGMLQSATALAAALPLLGLSLWRFTRFVPPPAPTTRHPADPHRRPA